MQPISGKLLVRKRRGKQGQDTSILRVAEHKKTDILAS